MLTNFCRTFRVIIVCSCLIRAPKRHTTEQVPISPYQLKRRIALVRLRIAKPASILNLEVNMSLSLLAKRDPLSPLPQREETMDLGNRASRTDDDARIPTRERRFKRLEDLLPSGHADFFGILKNDSTLSLLTATPAAIRSSSNTWFTSPSPTMKA